MRRPELSFDATDDAPLLAAPDFTADYAALEAEVWNGDLDGRSFYAPDKLIGSMEPRTPEEWHEYGLDAKLLALFGATKASFERELIQPLQESWANLVDVLKQANPIMVRLPDRTSPYGDSLQATWQYHYKSAHTSSIKTINLTAGLAGSQAEAEDAEQLQLIAEFRRTGTARRRSPGDLSVLSGRLLDSVSLLRIADQPGGDFERATEPTDDRKMYGQHVSPSSKRLETIAAELDTVLAVGTVRSQAVLRGEAEARLYDEDVRRAIRLYRTDDFVDDPIDPDRRMLDFLRFAFCEHPIEKNMLRDLRAANDTLRYNPTTEPVVNFGNPFEFTS